MNTHTIEQSFKKCLDLDFPKINQKLNTEIPLEVKSQINTVLLLLREAIGKLRISLILPKILENPKVLTQYIKDTKYNHCIELVQTFREKTKSATSQKLHVDDYYLIQLIDYFHENYEILNVLPNWLDDIDSTENFLLMALDDVYHIAQDRFLRTATADLAKEKRLHEVYCANERIKQDIKHITHQIKSKKISDRWKLAAKSGLVKKLKDELAFKQYDNNVFVQRKMDKCHLEINSINNALATKQQELDEELKRVRGNYETNLNANIKKQKQIREERDKIQLQLLALIKKFDDTLYAKYVEQMNLKDELEKEKENYENFLVTYREEEALYYELVIKKEEHFRRLHEAKILLFSQTHCAKKIQKWWRMMLKKKQAAKAKKGNQAKAPAKGETNKDVARRASKGKKK